MKVPNQYRISHGRLGSGNDIGNCGAFAIPIIDKYVIDGIKTAVLLEKMPPTMASKKDSHCVLFAIADDGFGSPITGWEHVSVRKTYNNQQFIPSWMEMCLIKSLFWDDGDCVIQYHPSKKDSINFNQYVLHLWRPVHEEMPMPPKELV